MDRKNRKQINRPKPNHTIKHSFLPREENKQRSNQIDTTPFNDNTPHCSVSS